MVRILSFIYLLFIFPGIIQAEQNHWTTLPNSPSTTYRFEDLSFVNEMTGWVAAGSSGVYKTTNGGDSWNLYSVSSGTYIRCVSFATALTGYAGNLNASSGNAFYKTTDGGLTWHLITNIPSPGALGLCGIWIYDSLTVNACGKYSGSPRFIRTSDGGITWIARDLSSLATGLVDCYFYSRDSGYVVGHRSTGGGTKGIILFTSDGGQNWETRYTTILNTNWGWKFSFPAENTGYVSMQVTSASAPQFYLKTTDKGATWSEILYEPNNIGIKSVQGIGFADSTLGWVGLFGGGLIYETKNGGETWEELNFGSAINRFRFLNDSLGYAVGQRVYKFKRQTMTGISQISNLAAVSFNLYQNYPNPFNPATKIRFDVSKPERINLALYDMNGREVNTLVNEILQPGSYEVNFNASALSSGIYYYRMKTGEYMQTRKMLLVK